MVMSKKLIKCINCKFHKKLYYNHKCKHKNNITIEREPLNSNNAVFGYSKTINYKLCSKLNLNNDCKLFKPKIRCWDDSGNHRF